MHHSAEEAIPQQNVHFKPGPNGILNNTKDIKFSLTKVKIDNACNSKRPTVI